MILNVPLMAIMQLAVFNAMLNSVSGALVAYVVISLTWFASVLWHFTYNTTASVDLARIMFGGTDRIPPLIAQTALKQSFKMFGSICLCAMLCPVVRTLTLIVKTLQVKTGVWAIDEVGLAISDAVAELEQNFNEHGLLHLAVFGPQ